MWGIYNFSKFKQEVKIKISIIITLSLSLLLTSCQDNLPPIYEEHLYLWKSTQNENVSFFMSINDDEHNTMKFDSSTQSLTQYIDKAEEPLFSIIGIFTDYYSINTIKRTGHNNALEYVKYSGQLYIGLKHLEKNPLFDNSVTDKNKIEYYPISVPSPGTGGKPIDKLYFRQDKVSDTIDVLVINIASNETVFQRSFEANPEYVYIPKRDSTGKPLN